ncbi:MAG: S49 family peptidase [Proteobacteria bacterium]|nr:S49 family peptidase [Pseudomonadota bacterium]MBU1455749.1 S49 family peptidase [Pseudomonadota bacterium]
MSIEHILTEVFNTPLFVTPDKLSAVLGVLERKSGTKMDINLSALLPAIGSDANRGAVMASARPVNTTDEKNAAIIGVLGSLTYRNGGNPSVGSGLLSYRSLQQQIMAMLSDNDVLGAILDVNSYGGSAQGCERMARFIRAANEQKPIISVIDMNCFSAAYYLAAASGKVILTDNDCGAGSVGCIAVFRDQSQHDEQEGFAYETFTFGEKKAELSPHTPLTDAARKKLQMSVDVFGRRFAASVAEFRGVPESRILDTKAGVFYGQDAIDAGLADAIAPFDEAVAMLAAEIDKRQQKKIYGGASMEGMTTQERMEKLLGAADGQQAIAALGYIKKVDAEKQQSEALASAAPDNTELLEKLQICQIASLSLDQSMKLIGEDLSLEEMRKTIQAMKAAGSQQTTVKSTITPLSAGEKNPLIAACEAVAQKMAK